MKRILSFVLVMALLLSLFTVPVFASEPEDGNEPLGPTTGPTDKFNWMGGGAILSFNGPTEPESAYVLKRVGDMTEGHLEVDNEAVPGATYDLASNTLTIKDLKLPEHNLDVFFMGDDFKLKVEGECELGGITPRNFYGFHSTSLNIIGTGTLTVNENRARDKAMYLYGMGDGNFMHLDIADSVTVHFYGQESESEEDLPGVVSLWSSRITPEQGGAITVGGKAIPEVKSVRRSYIESETLAAATVRGPDDVNRYGKQVRSKSDPDGIYAVSMYTIYNGTETEKRCSVTKFRYYPEFDMMLPDPSFTDGEYGESKTYTEAEFEKEFTYVLESQPKGIRYTTEERVADRGFVGIKLTKTDDPDHVYIATDSRWHTNRLDDDIDTYHIYRATWNETEERYVIDNEGNYDTVAVDELEAEGYSIVTETVEQPAEMTCWIKENNGDDWQQSYKLLTCASDPDGLYVYLYAYTYQGVMSGVKVSPVDYDEENDRYYARGYYGGVVGVDTFDLDYNDFVNGNTEFSYKMETVNKRVEVKYLTPSFDYDNYSSEATLTTKDGALYAYDAWRYKGETELRHHSLFPVEYREAEDRYYKTGGDIIDDFDEVSEIEALGYQVVMEDQPVEYTAAGSVNYSRYYEAYTDAEGNRYYTDWSGNVYSVDESNKFTYGDTEYYLGTLCADLKEEDITPVQHEIITDEYQYWIEGTEYHHIGTGEEPAPTAYDLWVNNEQITSDHLTVQCGRGTATFNPAAATLTLDNAEITQGVPYEQLYTGILTYLPKLTVVVKGDCTITETGGDGIGSYNFESYQIGDVIYPMPYDITVTGDGTLTITESSGMYGYGLYCTGKLVLDGVDLTINSSSTGVWANDLEIRSSKADIHCNSRFSGIVVNRGNLLYENSTVNAVSDEGAGLLIGSDVDVANLIVNSGSLSLKGKLGIQNVTAKSVVTVNGGRLSVEGETAAFDETFLADDAANIVMGEGIGVTFGAIDGKAVVIEELSASSGFTLSGKATSYKTNDGVDDVTLTLTGSDVDYTDTDTVTASYKGVAASTAYTFENVPAGSYVLKVEKGNHVTREYTVAVSADTTQDVKINPIGDADGNGRVNSADAKAAFKHAGEDTLIEDEYLFKCADVVKPSKNINSADAKGIFQHVNETKTLWTVTAE